MWTLVSSVLDFHFIYVTVFIYLFTFSGASASDQRAIYAISRGKCTLDRVVHPRARAVCTVGDQVVYILPRRGFPTCGFPGPCLSKLIHRGPRRWSLGRSINMTMVIFMSKRKNRYSYYKGSIHPSCAPADVAFPPRVPICGQLKLTRRRTKSLLR